MINQNESFTIRSLRTNDEYLHVGIEVQDDSGAVARTEVIDLPLEQDKNPALRHLVLGVLHVIQDQIYAGYGEQGDS